MAQPTARTEEELKQRVLNWKPKTPSGGPSSPREALTRQSTVKLALFSWRPTKPSARRLPRRWNEPNLPKLSSWAPRARNIRSAMSCQFIADHFCGFRHRQREPRDISALCRRVWLRLWRVGSSPLSPSRRQIATRKCIRHEAPRASRGGHQPRGRADPWSGPRRAVCGPTLGYAPSAAQPPRDAQPERSRAVRPSTAQIGPDRATAHRLTSRAPDPDAPQ
jgi:hypothetical protein